MSPTRVAIVAHATLPDDRASGATPRRSRDAGHEVDIDRAIPGSATRRRSGVRIVRLPIRRQFSGFAGHLAEYLAFAALASVRLAVEHRQRRYRLVQVATLPDFLAFAALPVRLTGVPSSSTSTRTCRSSSGTDLPRAVPPLFPAHLGYGPGQRGGGRCGHHRS